MGEQTDLFHVAPPWFWFDGKTYDPELDQGRLSKQIFVVWRAMNDGAWHTLSGLADTTGFPEASISARIRDFRKDRFGSHTVIHERLAGKRGLWRYRLVPRQTMGEAT